MDDQSSGKSSVLEGLTGLSFPIASELCTRFATQIVLRRAPASDSSVKIYILPGASANNDEKHKESCQTFAKTISSGNLSGEEFSNILDEVSHASIRVPCHAKFPEGLRVHGTTSGW